MKRLALSIGMIVGLAPSAQAAPKIWDIPFGTPASALPATDFVDPACGTNGGPAGLPIGSFARFAACPEEASGLREIWFVYDDAAETVALALRRTQTASTTTILDQPVILSFLLDRDGRVTGFRIFTDPRAEPSLRLAAHEVMTAFRARFGLGRECSDLPLAAGEAPVDGRAVKQLCRKESDGRRVVAEARLLYKPGQNADDPVRARLALNEFESWARLEVVQTAPLPPAPPSGAPVAAATAPASDRRAAFLAGTTADCPGCDLADADLRRRDLGGADLSGANLEGAILHRANLRRANLTGANLFGANLNRANLGFAKLSSAKLGEAMLYAADASRADLAGVDLAGARMGKAQLPFADLSGARLEGADLGEARLNDANLAGALLDDAYLSRAALARADLRGARAIDANLAEAGLRGARLDGAVLRGADLFKADLTGAQAQNADFSGARLLSAILGEVERTGATFTGAVMPDNSIGR